MKTFISTFILLLSQLSFATPTEVWKGGGSLFDSEGKELTTYTLIVEDTKTGHLIQRDITVTVANGQTNKITCRITQTDDDSWGSECGYVTGGGQCFGDGMCLTYEQDTHGKAFATVIAHDGATDMRLLRTEMQDGKAVHFYRERLHKH